MLQAYPKKKKKRQIGRNREREVRKQSKNENSVIPVKSLTRKSLEYQLREKR